MHTHAHNLWLWVTALRHSPATANIQLTMSSLVAVYMPFIAGLGDNKHRHVTNSVSHTYINTTMLKKVNVQTFRINYL